MRWPGLSPGPEPGERPRGEDEPARPELPRVLLAEKGEEQGCARDLVPIPGYPAGDPGPLLAPLLDPGGDPLLYVGGVEVSAGLEIGLWLPVHER